MVTKKVFAVSATFRCHDVQDHFVGGTHAIGSDGGEIMDTLVNTIIDDAFAGADTLSFHGEEG